MWEVIVRGEVWINFKISVLVSGYMVILIVEIDFRRVYFEEKGNRFRYLWIFGYYKRF